MRCQRLKKISIFAYLLFMMMVSPALGEEILAGRVFSIQGQAEVSRDEGRHWRNLSLFQDLYQKDIIRTKSLSRISILLIDKTMIKIDAKSVIKLADVIPSKKIKMGTIVKAALIKAVQSTYNISQGRFWFKSDTTVRIEMPNNVVGVRGTEFGLIVEENGETVLSMIDGISEMSNPFGSITVTGGEQGVAKPGMAPVKRLLIRPDDAVQWSLSYPIPMSFRDYFFISPNPGELSALLSEVENKLQRKRTDWSLWLLKGQLLHDLGRWDEAQETFVEVLNSGSMTAKAYEGLGWIELQKGNLSPALVYFEKVEPPTEMSVIGESLALYRTGKAVDALKLVTDAQKKIGKTAKLLVQSALFKVLYGNSGEALGDLRVAVETEKNSLAYGLMANIFLVHNQKDKALEMARESVKINPWSATAHVDLAWAKQSHFDLPGAMASARKAIELDRDNIRARVTLSQLLFGADYLAEAEDMIEAVLKVSPDEPLAHTLRGFLHLAKREADPAIQSFQRATMLDSTQASPHLGLGIAYMRKTEVELALEEMLVATLLEPREAMNYTYLGKALYQIRDFDKAMNALERAKILDPKDPSPFLYTGIINTDLNHAARAVQDIEKSIELNDNRAVYRSRFLLDEDRAVKNVSLARTYETLGLSDMARNRAMLSLKDDPNNSSAHLFMAKVLVNEQDRTAASGSEILKALLLEPVNLNSFNSFNEYTTFFERPDIGGSPEIQGGNHGTGKAIMDVWGSSDNVAGRWILTAANDNGFKDNNFNRFWSQDVIGKTQIGLNQDILFRYYHTSSKSGDTSTDSNAFAREDRDSFYNEKWDSFTLGYHFRVSPTSDILLMMKRDIVKGSNENGPQDERLRTLIPPDLYIQQSFDQLNYKQSYWQLGGLHLAKVGVHGIVYGFEYFTGETTLEDLQQDLITGTYYGIPIRQLINYPLTKNEIRPSYQSLFLQDTWRIHPQLILEGGIFYEKTKDGTTIPVFSSREFSMERISPRLGLIFKPNKNHTIRVGYARYLQSPFISPERLAPTDIAGFTIGQNALSSAFQEDLSLAWEWQMNPELFLRGELFHRNRIEQREDPIAEEFLPKEREFTGGSIGLNIMFLKYFSFIPRYSYTRNKEKAFALSYDNTPDRWRDDHQLYLGLNFLHPTGWKAKINASYIRQILDSYETESPSGFWLVNFSLQKELFNKHLTLGCNVNNLFDQKFQLMTDALNVNRPLTTRQILFFTRYNF